MEHSDNGTVSFLASNAGTHHDILGNLKTIGNILGIHMSTSVKTGAGGKLWHDQISGLSDNDQADHVNQRTKRIS